MVEGPLHRLALTRKFGLTRQFRQLRRSRLAVRIPSRRGQVIAGWDQVLRNEVGGKRIVVIPPHLATGARRGRRDSAQCDAAVRRQLIVDAAR